MWYKIIATPDELEQVEMALNSLGIYFERRQAEWQKQSKRNIR